MNNPRSLVILILLLMGLATASASAADEKQWISLIQGPTFELSERKQAASTAKEDFLKLPIPVSISEGVGEVSLKLQDVRREKRTAEAYWAAFKVDEKLDTSIPSRAPAIKVLISRDAPIESGTYSLTVLASRETSKDTPLKIDVVLPSATLRPPGILKLEREGLANYSIDTKDFNLELRETGRLAAARGLNLTILSITGPDGARLDGKDVTRTEKQNPVPVVPPGEPVQFSPALEGSLPVGISNVTAEIWGDNLTAPVPVSWQITVRRWRGLIWIFILLGLGVGWFTRWWLQGRIQAAEAREQAFLVLARLEEELQRPDAELRKTLNGLRDDLQGSIEAGDTKSLTTETNNASAGLEAALKDLGSRRQASEQELQVFEEVVLSRWFLPASMAGVLVERQPAAAAARALLRDSDVAGAAGVLANATTGLVDLLRPLAEGWSKQVDEDLARAESANEYLPADVIDVSEELQTLQKEPDGISSLLDGGGSELDSVRAWLGAIDPFRKKLQRLLRQVRIQYEDALDRTLLELASAGGTGVVPLRAESRVWTSELDRLDAAPEEALRLLGVAKLLPLQTRWVELLETPIASLSDPSKTEAQDALRARRYPEAARILRRSAAAPANSNPFESTRRGLGGAPSALETASGIPLMSPREREILAEPGALVMNGGSALFRFALRGVPRTRQQNTSERQQLQFLATFIPGLLLAAIGYVMFYKNWIGTPEELLQVFLWAYGLDIASNTVISQAATIRRSTS